MFLLASEGFGQHVEVHFVVLAGMRGVWSTQVEVHFVSTLA